MEMPVAPSSDTHCSPVTLSHTCFKYMSKDCIILSTVTIDEKKINEVMCSSNKENLLRTI